MDATANARRLRQSQTLPEKMLWTLVRAHRLGGFKFKRQVPVGGYFADFVCEQARLIVELDAPRTRGERTMTPAAPRRSSGSATWC